MLKPADAALSSKLDTKLIKAPEPHIARHVRTPFGRIGWTRDRGTGGFMAGQNLSTHLQAIHRNPSGKVIDVYDLGSGNVQMNLVVALSADALGTGTSLAAPILGTRSKYMYSGTGSTVNTYDFQLQTAIATASGAVTPTLGITANNSTLQYVGTITYGAGASVTEWGLFNNNTTGAISTATTDTFTSTSIATATWNNAPGGTTGVTGWAGYVAVTGTVGGFILSNSTATTSSAVTVNGWYNLTAGGGTATTPTSNSSISIYPLMFDHKTFGVITVNSGDSIQYTYTLTIQSGG